ncbi:MAG: hypothetical protein LBH63_04295, partial [Clostridiales Family XIII bacterium]|nr:hypothetical protein [Clostridiales Family XIII bacterium]
MDTNRIRISRKRLRKRRFAQKVIAILCIAALSASMAVFADSGLPQNDGAEAAEANSGKVADAIFEPIDEDVSDAQITASGASTKGFELLFSRNLLSPSSTITPVFAYRAHDDKSISRDTDWKGALSDTTISGYVRYKIEGEFIDDDTEYDYVLTYSPTKSTNLPRIVYKAPGKFMRKSDGTWVASNAEPSILTEGQPSSDCGYRAVLDRNPSLLKYQGGLSPVFATSVPEKHLDLEMGDALDGTPCMSTLTVVNAKMHVYTSGGPGAGKSIAGYEQYKTIGTGSDSDEIVNEKSLKFPYRLQTQGYYVAIGMYAPWGNNDGGLKNGGVMTPNDDNHTVTDNGGMTLQWKFTINLQSETLAVRLPIMKSRREQTGLFPGTVVRAADEESAEVCDISISDDESLLTIDFDKLSGSRTVRLEAAADGLATVPFEFEADKDAYTVTLKNLDQVRSATNDAVYDSSLRMFTKLVQMPQLTISETAKGWLASSVAMEKFLEKTTSYYPGIKNSYKFTIINDGTGKTYRLVDYSINEAEVQLGRLLRTGLYTAAGGDSALEKFFKTYAADYPADILKRNDVEYIYNFEGITGMSLYDALLKMYRENGYPDISSLTELPPAVLGQEVLGGDCADFPPGRIDLSAPHPGVDYLDSGSNIRFLEKDPNMIDLAGHHLYNNSLVMTFDSEKVPLPSSLDSPRPEDAKLLHGSYVARTRENREMMNSVLGVRPTLKPNEEIRFDHFAYGLYGDLIFNAYRPSDYGIAFDFALLLSVVGIQGIAFEDANENG